MIKFPLYARRGASGAWIETADGLTIANMNDLAADEDELFDLAETLAAGANQLHERENPSAPWTSALRKRLNEEG